MFKKSIFQFILFFSLISNGQDLHPKPNYDLATRFSTKNVAKMVHSTSVYPNWLKTGNRFWYQYKTVYENSVAVFGAVKDSWDRDGDTITFSLDPTMPDSALFNIVSR